MLVYLTGVLLTNLAYTLFAKSCPFTDIFLAALMSACETCWHLVHLKRVFIRLALSIAPHLEQVIEVFRGHTVATKIPSSVALQLLLFEAD